MHEVIKWGIVTAVLLIAFAVLAVLGIKKKKLNLFITSIAVLLLSIACGCYAAFKFIKRVLPDGPRTGEEIYTALLGKSPYDCSRIISYQDQTIPKIDYAIFLHFETCSQEFTRLLGQHQFTCEKVRSHNSSTTNPAWFDPTKLGDSILVYQNIDSSTANGQIMYVSLDSTKVMYEDILD